MLRTKSHIGVPIYTHCGSLKILQGLTYSLFLSTLIFSGSLRELAYVHSSIASKFLGLWVRTTLFMLLLWMQPSEVFILSSYSQIDHDLCMVLCQLFLDLFCLVDWWSFFKVRFIIHWFVFHLVLSSVTGMKNCSPLESCQRKPCNRDC